jgi:signal transduction histidine kinase
MKLEQIRAHFLPPAEKDPKFLDYLRRLSLPGLQTVAAVEFGTPILLTLGRWAAAPHTISFARFMQGAAMMIAGLVTLAISTTPFSRRHARILAAVSAWISLGLLQAMAITQSVTAPDADDYSLAAITLVVVTTVSTVPFLPWQALTFGMSVEAMYGFVCFLAARSGLSLPPHGDAHHVFLIALALLSTGIAATNYRHRRDEYDANQESIRVAEALTGAQLRAQLAENAISIGKMAAALSHEINSPLGTLRSSIDTLGAITDRLCAASPAERERLRATALELRDTVHQSAARIEEVTKRLRRFVSLDEAELKSADLNELLSDVTLLHEREIQDGHIQLRMDLESKLPRLNCRPQLLSAAFSSLLRNAIQAVNGTGRIEIQTRSGDSSVEVFIRDNGRGMSPDEAENAFDPAFKVSGSRVSSANWSLFNSRQIVYEHGGEIRLDSSLGRGTTVQVTLPVS